jgi:hypothetical protein
MDEIYRIVLDDFHHFRPSPAGGFQAPWQKSDRLSSKKSRLKPADCLWRMDKLCQGNLLL